MSRNCVHCMMVMLLFQFTTGCHFSLCISKNSKALKDIKKEAPVVVFFKSFLDDTEKRVSLLCAGDVLPPADLPTIITPKGLDHERQMYLFNETRQFCKEGTEHLIAPEPQSRETQTCY